MKINSLSSILYIPLGLSVLYFIFFEFSSYSPYSVYVFVPLVLFVVVFTANHHIDYWYLKKYPVPLDPRIIEWLKNTLPYYRNLSDQDRIKFENRLLLYLRAREFQAVGSKENRDVPYDLRSAIASQAIIITMGFEDFLVGQLDRIYMYKHPFPSPLIRELHTLEVHQEDGLLIFSLEQAIAGIIHPKLHYNIVMHGYLEYFINANAQLNLPDFQESDWETIEKVTSMSKEVIHETIGLPTVHLSAVHVCSFIQNQEMYSLQFPEYAKRIGSAFSFSDMQVKI